MPFKPRADKYDYPENFSTYPKNPDWIARHQQENMMNILGQDIFFALSLMENHKELSNVLRKLPT